MKSLSFFLGILLGIVLLIPANIISSLLVKDSFQLDCIAVFYQIIQIATTITCTCVIVNKLNQTKDKDD